MLRHGLRHPHHTFPVPPLPRAKHRNDRLHFPHCSDCFREVIKDPHDELTGQNLKSKNVKNADNQVAKFRRYVAVHNPLNYKQAMNDDAAIRKVEHTYTIASENTCQSHFQRKFVSLLFIMMIFHVSIQEADAQVPLAGGHLCHSIQHQPILGVDILLRY